MKLLDQITLFELTDEKLKQLQHDMVHPHWIVLARHHFTMFEVDGPFDFQKLAIEMGETLYVYQSKSPVLKGIFRVDLDYGDYIRSAAWKKKAKEAKERAGWRCQICNRHKREVTLHAHHRTYERLGYEFPEDITVLCEDCHKKFHEID